MYHVPLMLCVCRIICALCDNCRETFMCDLWEWPGADWSATEIGASQAKPREWAEGSIATPCGKVGQSTP
jgi:hypothetical protein